MESWRLLQLWDRAIIIMTCLTPGSGELELWDRARARAIIIMTCLTPGSVELETVTAVGSEKENA